GGASLARLALDRSGGGLGRVTSPLGAVHHETIRRMIRWRAGFVLFLVVSAVLALDASCRRKPAPPAAKPKSPAVQNYTPLPAPPTPTLRPGQPTRPPEPAC